MNPNLRMEVLKEMLEPRDDTHAQIMKLVEAKVKELLQFDVALSSDEFYQRMAFIVATAHYDPEAVHYWADELMKQQLRTLGYVAGVDAHPGGWCA